MLSHPTLQAANLCFLRLGVVREDEFVSQEGTFERQAGVMPRAYL